MKCAYDCNDCECELESEPESNQNQILGFKLDKFFYF